MCIFTSRCLCSKYWPKKISKPTTIHVNHMIQRIFIQIPRPKMQWSDQNRITRLNKYAIFIYRISNKPRWVLEKTSAGILKFAHTYCLYLVTRSAKKVFKVKEPHKHVEFCRCIHSNPSQYISVSDSTANSLPWNEKSEGISTNSTRYDLNSTFRRNVLKDMRTSADITVAT